MSIRRLATIPLAFPVAALVAPNVAQAHAHLSGSSPAAGAVVASPVEVSLSFSQPLEKRFSAIEVQDSSGRPVSGVAARPTEDARGLTAAVPTLAAGVYTVIWHATSVDTHRTEGSFTFTVAP